MVVLPKIRQESICLIEKLYPFNLNKEVEIFCGLQSYSYRWETNDEGSFLSISIKRVDVFLFPLKVYRPGSAHTVLCDQSRGGEKPSGSFLNVFG